jgi:hypothetical protein
MPCRVTEYQKEQWRIAEEEKRQREELKQRIRARKLNVLAFRCAIQSGGKWR